MRRQSRQSPSDFVADLAWDEVERRLAEGVSAILPVGAAAKEHGLHLPMNTDEIQANWLAKRMAGFGPALVWPALTYGFYPAFRVFPGSVSLSNTTFMTLVSEVISEIVRWAPLRLFVLDTGISTIQPVAAAIAARNWERPVVHLKIHEGTHYRAACERLREQTHGSHADELETSRMLVIAPRSVTMARARGNPGPITGALTRDNAPSGAYGTPEVASELKGQQLLDAMLRDLRATYAMDLATPAAPRPV